ncbi:MAG: trypsin-like peptidase domain-containing protein [Clostridia bacterium]|nr:trypsin-like peptidase domain-containing protein [Clostridia bacterium]
MDQQDKMPQDGFEREVGVDANLTQPVMQPPQNNAENTENSYTYRWSYADQSAFDLKNKQKEKKRGPITFAIVMILAFAVCIALLIGVMIWNENSPASDPAETDMSVAEVAESVIPGTVFITATVENGSGSYGTGFFVRSNGYIATNYHVVEGATNIQVTLTSGENLGATLIGYTVADDVAVLKIEGNNYPTLSIGDSDALRVGETLVAVGHPLGIEAPWTTTQGIVSALNREITVQGTYEHYEVSMFQTDAALNPGNSGGPICNLRGEVVGIVSRKMIDSEGLSLALPINGCIEIIDTIISDGHAKNVVSSISKTRPNIGISGSDILEGECYTVNNRTYTAETDGVLISSVQTNSASYGVLKAGDIMVAIDETSFNSMDELKELLYQYRAGDRVTITIIRYGTQRNVSVILGAPYEGK